MKQILYSQQDVRLNASFYNHHLEYNVFDGWEDRDKYGNFHKLIKLASFAKYSLEDARCLDIGCGTGDLSGFLRNYGIASYKGIDIFKPSLGIAKEKYPKEKFIYGDFLNLPIKKAYDFVFCSGTLATKLKSDNYTVFEAFIKKMWKITNIGIAYNFLFKDYKVQKENDLFLYDLKKMTEMAKNIVGKPTVKIRKNRAGDNFEFAQAHIYIYR